jgi:hypothetical protein
MVAQSHALSRALLDRERNKCKESIPMETRGRIFRLQIILNHKEEEQ